MTRLLGYEALMVVRQRGLWIALAPVLALIALVTFADARTIGNGQIPRSASAATFMVVLFGLAITAALTTFFRADRRGMNDLLAAAPATTALRLAAKAIGALSLTAPLLVILVAIGVFSGMQGHGYAGVPGALVVYAAVVLPGALMALALASFAGAYLPDVAARVTAVVVWLAATIASPTLLQIPTPTGTVLSPAGDYAAAGYFGASGLYAGQGLVLAPTPSPAWATVSVAALVALSASLLIAGSRRS